MRVKNTSLCIITTLNLSGFLDFLNILFYNSRWILDLALGFSIPLNSSTS
ncbi:hypothetical protein RhiirA1_457347 [Rhizophagus irregularis]|uniref:Uncharacterized protein n=1 Tax=Rhizophagus irregularis TaxID=588596 RepID=A0A2N0RYJ1_9GLOM|nr:hypothetical protein RhiirA1_457347 [Rhizophagus irregularis]